MNENILHGIRFRTIYMPLLNNEFFSTNRQIIYE